MTIGFGARLAQAFGHHGHLCVGIDPHAFLLDAWGLSTDAAGVREFGLRVVDAAAGRIGIVKPQVAFFERFGSAGYRALEDVLAAARTAGLLVIADVKRGDIGSSMEAYGQAWLTPGSPLEAAAMTVTAFQGVGSLDTVMRLARANGKGLFVLAATSNTEAAGIQKAAIHDEILGTRSVSRVIIDDVTHFNARFPDDPIGSIGVVLGATLDLRTYGIDTGGIDTRGIDSGGIDSRGIDSGGIDSGRPHAPAVPVLAPGFGYQGARAADAAAIFGSLLPATVISVSRSVLTAGPSGLADALTRESKEVQDAVH